MTVPARPAASMVIIDDRPDLHVLIGRRRPGPFVGGMIVYPGGAVDDADHELGAVRCAGASAPGLDAAAAAAHLHAAIRESREEVGLWPDSELVVDGADFPAVGHWITPEESPRRYDTRFFLARHPGGEAHTADDELVEVWWERPADALRRLETGDLQAIDPTISFLTSLSRYRHVDDAFAGSRQGHRHQFEWGVTTL